MQHLKSYRFFSALLAVLLFASCSTSKDARKMKDSINGNWTLKTITIEGNPSIMKVKVFNEADNNCFIGSSWNFIGNNGTGSYTIPTSADGCPASTRKIKWNIYEPKDESKKFQFKRLDEKNNPLDDNNGYRLSIGSLTGDNMQLRSEISYNGSPVTVVYNFEKNNLKN